MAQIQFDCIANEYSMAMMCSMRMGKIPRALELEAYSEEFLS